MRLQAASFQIELNLYWQRIIIIECIVAVQTISFEVESCGCDFLLPEA